MWKAGEVFKHQENSRNSSLPIPPSLPHFLSYFAPPPLPLPTPFPTHAHFCYEALSVGSMTCLQEAYSLVLD